LQQLIVRKLSHISSYRHISLNPITIAFRENLREQPAPGVDLQPRPIDVLVIHRPLTTLIDDEIPATVVGDLYDFVRPKLGQQHHRALVLLSEARMAAQPILNRTPRRHPWQLGYLPNALALSEQTTKLVGNLRAVGQVFSALFGHLLNQKSMSVTRRIPDLALDCSSSQTPTTGQQSDIKNQFVTRDPRRV
jgi:hypothetical protein